MHQFMFFALFFLCITVVQAQHKVAGRVVDEATNVPLEFVSVYVNTTTRGTTTNEQGQFSLSFPSGKYELVVTYLGYTPIIYPVDTEQLPGSILFKLSKKTVSLQEVVVSAKRDESWYTNLAVFKENFLGRSALGKQCKLLNPEVLTIVFDPETGILNVSSDELLQLENPALGYKIDYLLEDFKLYTKERYTYFLGYLRYIPMKGSSRKQKRWARKRTVAYKGSSMHFVRALRSKQLEEEGFNLRRLYRVPNPNRPTDDEIAAAREAVRIAGNIANVPDTIASVLARTSQPKLIEQLDRRPVPYEEFLSIDTDNIILSFKDFFHVVYTGEMEEQAYLNSISIFKPRSPTYQTSIISLKSSFVLLEENGTITAPLDLLYEGYWGFEKVGDMLPLDYGL